MPEVDAATAVLVANSQGLAVRAERHRVYPGAAGVGEGCDRLCGGDIPDVGLAVGVTGGQGPAVRTERDRVHALGGRVGEGGDQLCVAGPGGIRKVDYLNAAAGGV